MPTFMQKIHLPVVAGTSLDIQRLIAVLELAKRTGATLENISVERENHHTRSIMVSIPFPEKLDPIEWMPLQTFTEAKFAVEVQRLYPTCKPAKPAPKVEAPKVEAPKVEEVKVEAPKVEEVKEEAVTNG